MAESSNVVRAFPYPILETGNLSFPEGGYKVEMKPDGNSIHVQHLVEGASFVERLVNEKKAVCCCTVSVPKASYRKIYQDASFSQTLELDSDWLAEPPILRPFIVCCESMEYTFSHDDGVNDVWIGQSVSLNKGVKIAFGPVFRLASSMRTLLDVVRDDQLEKGQVAVEACSDKGFYFRVKMAGDLFNFNRNPGGENLLLHSRSILIHAVSACFALLAKNYSNEGEGEDEWRSYSNLKALAADMESKGLDIWNADEFLPEKAATAMYPHPIPKSPDE